MNAWNTVLVQWEEEKVTINRMCRTSTSLLAYSGCNLSRDFIGKLLAELSRRRRDAEMREKTEWLEEGERAQPSLHRLKERGTKAKAQVEF